MISLEILLYEVVMLCQEVKLIKEVHRFDHRNSNLICSMVLIDRYLYQVIPQYYCQFAGWNCLLSDKYSFLYVQYSIFIDLLVFILAIDSPNMALFDQ